MIKKKKIFSFNEDKKKKKTLLNGSFVLPARCVILSDGRRLYIGTPNRTAGNFD